MKKMIFLLLMAVAWAGIVFAYDTAHPPGVLTVNMSNTIEAALYGDSADDRVVTPYTVLAAVPFYVGQYTSVNKVGNDYYNERISRIIHWGEQYQSGELTKQKFAHLVTAQIELILQHQYIHGDYSFALKTLRE